MPGGSVTQAEVFKCEECSFETKREDGLTEHCKRKHSKGPKEFKCEGCSYETRIKRELTRHNKLHHSKDAQVHSCPECSFETIYKSGLTTHHKLKHAKEVELYKCPKCTFLTMSKYSLARHYKHRHSKDDCLYQCQGENGQSGSVCNQSPAESDILENTSPSCSIKQELKEESRADEFLQAQTVEVKEEKIDIEDHKPGWELTGRSSKALIFNSQKLINSVKMNQLEEDFKCKHSEKAEVFKCEACDFETNKKSALKIHLKYKHSEEAEVYNCHGCSYQTRVKGNFTKHYIFAHSKDTKMCCTH